MSLFLCGAALLARLAAREEPAYRYEVVAGPGARELRVEASFRSGFSGELEVDEGVGRFIRNAEVGAGGAWKPLERRGEALLARGCEPGGCRIRYLFLLSDAARGIRNIYRAFESGGAWLAPPSSWLLRPAREARGRYRLHVETPPGLAFVTGLFPSPDGAPNTYEADAASLPGAPYSAFGALEVAHVEVPGGSVQAAIVPSDRALPREALRRWVEASARAVAGYYSRFPVAHALVLVLPGPRGKVGFGTTLGGGGASIMVWVGPDTAESDLEKDWVLTHEMTHLAFPDCLGAPKWIEEGLATYVEPVARARAGRLTDERVWREFVDGLERALAGQADEGLDRARSWSRIYWGGALYWLLADLEIRERTGNARSLDDALRAVLDAGGNGSVTWPLERALEVAEGAVGVPALSRRKQQMGEGPLKVDADALWKRLGVARRAGSIVFDESAPLAALRRAITARPAAADAR